MKEAWFLRSRQLLSAMRFWISITGYDIHDRSRTSRVYFVYLVFFFSLWGLAVLALLSSAAALGLLQLSSTQPARTASIVIAFAMLVWWSWSLYGAARRSPIRFQPEDATLVCLTPISRPGVIFSWFLSEWFLTGISFWGMAIILGFALTEITLNGAPIWVNIPTYLGTGLLYLLPVFFIHAGLLAMTWAIGCLRLHGDWERKGLVWIPFVLGLLLISGVVLFSIHGVGWQLPSSHFLQSLLADSGLASYSLRVTIALSWMIVGGGALCWASQSVNLSRAAQETETAALVKSAGWMGNSQLIDTIKIKQRLQHGSPPTRIPDMSGTFAVLWKQTIQTVRSLNLGQLSKWFLIFGASLATMLAPDWSSRSMLILFWIIKVHERTSEDFRSDLGYWFLFQSLPHKPIPRLITTVIPSVFTATFLGWIAFAICNFAGMRIVPLRLYFVLPFFITIIAIAGVFDVIRQSYAEQLLTGKIPGPGMISVLLSTVSLTLNIVFLLIFRNNLSGLLVVILFSSLICLFLVALCKKSYQWLGR